MSIQNSPLFNRLPRDLLYHCLTSLDPCEQILFSETCHIAEQVITQLWARICSSFKETRYCLLSTTRIIRNFPHQFDNLAPQFPYLLSSNGLTYQNEEGIIRNVKCIFNWKSSALYFHTRSKDMIQVVAIVPGFDDESISNFNDFYYRPFSISSDSYFWNISTFDSLPNTNRSITTLIQSMSFADSMFSELTKAKPLQKEVFPICCSPLCRFTADDPLFQMFENARLNVQNLMLTENTNTLQRLK